MKRVVFLNDLKESDIRSEDTYNQYKNLLEEDLKKYFSDSSKLVDIDCPGCSAKSHEAVFKKMGFDYHVCKSCGSIFVSPRPKEEAIRLFYKDSKSGAFLRKVFLDDKAESRREEVFSYRTQWIMGLIEEYLPDSKVFLDYGTRYPVFLGQLNKSGLFESILSVLPECYEKEDVLSQNAKVVNNKKDLTTDVDIFAAFEIAEKIFSPKDLFGCAGNACKKGGLFIMTSTTSSGFEYQVLGQHSPNIIPMDRLNLLSLEALAKQVEEAGFEVVELSTPGRLDVEMVKKAYEKDPEVQIDPFWKYIFNNRDKEALHSLQEYLQQFQLSSHVRIAAIKR